MDLARLGEFVVNHWMLSAAFVLILLLLIGSELRRHLSGVPQVGPNEAIRLINQEDAVVVDIRDEGEFKGGHIADALHLPEKHLSERIKSLEKYRGRPLITYCRSGHRSVAAAQQLRKLGFEQVHNLAGGILAWEGANLPVRRSK